MNTPHSGPFGSEEKRPRKKLAEKIVADFVRRRDQGEHPSADALLAEHAEVRDELSAELRKLNLVQAAIAKAAPGTSLNPCPLPRKEGAVEPSRADTAAHFSTHPQRVRCPSCGEPIDLRDGTMDGGCDTTTCDACGTTLSLVRNDAITRAGELVAHFQLVDLLGTGGFGSVWKAVDTKLNRVVALKLPRAHTTSAEIELFMREARTSAQLQHPNIVRVHEVGCDNGTVFIVSDLIDGEPLSQRLASGQLTRNVAATLCEKVARAMHYAHQQGVIHRDLKPQNVLVDQQGEPFITDFGLARRAAVELTMTTDGAILGTPVYMSPEQAAGDAHYADAKSDVYSIGVTLYQLLTGELPFRGSAASVVRQVIDNEPPRPRQLNTAIPRDLETICLKAMEKSPARRYQTAEALADDLRRWIEHRPIQAKPVGGLGRASRWCRRKPAIAALLGLLALVTTAGFTGVIWQWRKAESSLMETQAAKRLADANQQRAWEVVNELLTEVAVIDLGDEAHTGRVREKLVSRATHFLQRIAEENPNDARAQLEVARSLRKLALTIAPHEQIDAALAHIDEAILILNRLRQHQDANQDEVQFELAWTHHERARIRSSASHAPTDDGGFDDLEVAKSMLAELMARVPLSNQKERAKIRYSQANVAQTLGVEYVFRERPHAIAQLEEAAQMWESIAADHLEQIIPTYRRDGILQSWGSTLLAISGQEISDGNSVRAIEYAERAREVLREAHDLNPGSLKIRDAIVKERMALAYGYTLGGRTAEATICWKEALQLQTEIADDFPESPRHRLSQAIAASGVALALTQAGEGREALDYVQQAISIREAILKDHPQMNELHIEIMRSTFQMAEAQGLLGEYENAIANYQKAISIAEQQPVSQITTVVKGLSMNGTVASYRGLHELPRASELALNAESFWGEAIDAFSLPATRTGLSEALRHLTAISRESGQRTDARESLERLNEAVEQIEHLDADEPEAQWALGGARLEAGMTLMWLDDPGAAFEQLQAADAHYDLAGEQVHADQRMELLEWLIECGTTLDRLDDVKAYEKRLQSFQASESAGRVNAGPVVLCLGSTGACPPATS